MLYYIAGPMRGIYRYNFDAFDDAALMLSKRLDRCISPADLDRESGFDPDDLPDDHDWNTVPDDFDFLDCVNRDIEAIKKCDAIYMLSGWENSTGANAELALAKWLGLHIEYEVDPGEVMETDPDTGAKKGSKLARFDLIPAGPMWELAEHYGRGAKKYADRNWEAGYAWSLSLAAAMRHINLFWRGEDRDDETGSKHVICAAWHLIALAEFMETMPDKDNRPLTRD